MQPSFNQELSRKAFSLTEVLVVIAVIAILAALLYQIIGMARMAGYQAVNLSNLRTLGVGSLNYAADHDGQIPPQIQNDPESGGEARVFAGTGDYRGSSQTVPRHLPRGGYAEIDNYYTPFALRYPDRPPGQWASRINYFYTYQPRNPTAHNKSYPPEGAEELYNCSVKESPRALLYFNPSHPSHVQTLQYIHNAVSVVYLDASVRTFPLKTVQEYISEGGNYRIYYMENK